MHAPLYLQSSGAGGPPWRHHEQGLCMHAGVFKDGGMKDYLEYVRGSPQYESEFRESYFEWRDDVPDGLEVSTFSKASPAAAAAGAAPSDSSTA